uniref:Telomerase reverse transcriptase n=1 Tax=Esox lucius TaxID=8010 RepID=A0A6Q2Z186_ESOLU
MFHRPLRYETKRPCILKRSRNLMKMNSRDMTRVLRILHSLYPHVQTLEEFANTVVFREGHTAVLIEPSDTNRFISFVRGVFICRDKVLQAVPSCNQISTLPELLAFVLNNMKRRKKKNVLAHGYGYPPVLEERDADQFKFHGEVTQSAAYIQASDLWKRICQRLGTDVTKYLLESCSVFVAVPPSSAFQVCGVPLHDRVSISAGVSGFHLGRRRKAAPRARGSRPEKSCPCSSMRRRKEDGRDIRNMKDVEKEVRNKGEESLSGKRKRVEDGEVLLPKKRRCTQRDVVTTDNDEQMSEDSGLQRQAEPLAQLKQPAEEITGPVRLVNSEGSPSWRSGSFPPLPHSQCFIRILGMLYGGRGMRSFLLNRKKKGGAEGPRRLQGWDLVRLVFFEGLAYLNGTERKPKKLPRRFFSVVPLFTQLLRGHRSCPYSKIMQRFCPGLGDGEEGGGMAELLPQHSSPHRVYLFVRECLMLVVPPKLWGSDHNRLTFLSRVRNFLSMGKFEKVSLAELMWKIKVNDCDWLKISKKGRCPPGELSYRTRLLGQLLAWLLDGYVLFLVRAMFYVTESFGQKNALRFYRYQVWAKLQELAFRGHITKGQMSELTPTQVMSLPKTTVTARLRFIPKTDSMRVITRVTGMDPKTRSFQARVRDLLDVLRVCVRASPSLLGSTVWGMTDIHRVLSSFAPRQKHNLQPLYFVKVDVSGAYDSLPHPQLLEVIGQMLSHVKEEVFSVRRYAKVWLDSHEGIKKTFVRQADFRKDTVASSNMKGFLMSLQREGKVHDAILVEQVRCSVCGSVLLVILCSVCGRVFRQCRGIPQGSVVSSLLCCLCYGHMEKTLCLMRLVDDFLLITPDLSQAQTFLKTLMAGVPQYGCVVNAQKVAVNFPVREGFFCPAGVRLLPSHCLFPWCGLLVDTHTLDVYSDYSSYAGLSLRYSLTPGSSHCAGQQMRRKLMSILRLKCHALFLDLKNNSMEAVYKNIYKLVLLHACRFHVCCQSLPFGQTVSRNPAYFLHMIWDMSEYTNKLVRLCNKGTSLGCKVLSGSVQYEAVELIYCLSFLLVLSRHRPVYKDLLSPLNTRKRHLERKLGILRVARVRQAALPKTPEDFKAMRA